jgi:hypothetical protein
MRGHRDAIRSAGKVLGVQGKMNFQRETLAAPRWHPARDAKITSPEFQFGVSEPPCDAIPKGSNDPAARWPAPRGSATRTPHSLKALEKGINPAAAATTERCPPGMRERHWSKHRAGKPPEDPHHYPGQSRRAAPSQRRATRIPRAAGIAGQWQDDGAQGCSR